MARYKHYDYGQTRLVAISYAKPTLLDQILRRKPKATPTVADVSIDVKKLSTGVDQRDNHLRSDDFFNAEKFPAITFKSKRVIPGAGGAFKLVGDLTIRDVTKEVTLDCEAPAPTVNAMGAMRTATSATTTINRFDYNLKWNTMIETGGAVVGPDVKVTIDLELTKK